MQAPEGGIGFGGGTSDATGSGGALGSAPSAAGGGLFDRHAPDAPDANDASDADSGPLEPTGCMAAADCASKNCFAGMCQEATCVDRIINSDETDTDCGGPSCAPCATGQLCQIATDCATLLCAGLCQAATCADGVRNANESDVDCGGVGCSACFAGNVCRVAGDCRSLVCTAGTCQAALCTDGVQNNDESAIDCGGSCSACPLGNSCRINTDCTSGVCDTGSCRSPSCADSSQNGTETDTDCGGPSCGPCLAGDSCSQASDCKTKVCTAGVCQPATCSDTVANGAETDVDCGGGFCPACSSGASCLSASDCASGVCSSGTCRQATCSDGLENGGETGVDCGGSCPTCTPSACRLPDYAFCDDFEDGNATGWASTGGSWSVLVDGSYVYSGANGSYISTAGVTSTDQTVEAKLKILQFGGLGSGYRAGIVARFAGSTSYYVLAIDESRSVRLLRGTSAPSGASGTCGSMPSGLSTVVDTWLDLKIQVSGPSGNVHILTWVNTVGPIHDCITTSSTIASGTAGVMTYGSGTRAEFDDFRVSTP